MITTKVVYDRHKRATRTEPGTIDVRITIDRKTYYIGTGIKVLKSEWVAGAVCNRPDAGELNARVRAIYNRVMREVDECIESGEKFNLADIRYRVWRFVEAKQDNAFLDWIEDQLTLLNVVSGTRKHYNTLLVRLPVWMRWISILICLASHAEAITVHSMTSHLLRIRSNG